MDSEWEEIVETREDDDERTIISFEEEGDEVTGIFEEAFTFDGNFGESIGYKIKSIADDSKAIVWGTTVLNGKMDRVSEGSVIRIVYNGMKKSKRGGRTFKDFSVFSRRE